MRKILIFCVAVLLLFAYNNKNDQQSVSSSLTEGTIPIVYRGHIYIQGSADSIPGNFVFDTGASNLYFDSVFYGNNRFDYKNIEYAKLAGAGSTPQDVIVIMDTVGFSFGSHYYQTSAVPVFKLKPILGDFADGIIGLNYFSGSVLEINYVHEFIKLHETIGSVDIVDYRMLPMKRIANRLYIPLKIGINDSVSIAGEFTLDFGSGGCISLTSIIAKKFNLNEVIEHKVPYFTKYGGVGGESSSYDFMADSFQISDFGFTNVTMCYSTDKSGAMASKQYAGLLGNEILERFDIILDFNKNKLYLKLNEKLNQPFSFSRLGFKYVDRNQTIGAWIVTGLYQNSSVDQQGLKIDDRILSINGVPVSRILYQDQADFFKKLDELELLVKRGYAMKKFKIKLESIL